MSGYRTTAYVVSPYTKRRAVVSTQYNQTSILRTIELILGLPPMNQMDATATPMADCFTNASDPTPFTALPSNVPLDQMNPNGQRNPLATFPLPIQPTQLMPGASMRVPLPQAPAGAHYAMFMIGLADAQRNDATLDFLQLPLDIEIRPIIRSFSPGGGGLQLSFPTIPDRMYRIQQANDLRSSFFDIFTEIAGDGTDMDVMVPIGPGPQGYYRIVLDPE